LSLLASDHPVRSKSRWHPVPDLNLQAKKRVIGVSRIPNAQLHRTRHANPEQNWVRTHRQAAGRR
jgi:hypothetical protein